MKNDVKNDVEDQLVKKRKGYEICYHFILLSLIKKN